LVKNLTIDSEKGIRINKALIHSAIKSLKSELEITISSLSIVFLNSEGIKEINKQYLNHDFSTDIITFNYSGDNKDLDGEIFISIEDALENSKRFGCTVDNELFRLIIHGLLHMVGFDDHTIPERNVMTKNENKYLTVLENLIKDKPLIYDGKNS
jgi:rRNA maturation RNase YbeY